jgi:hypothetical protein
MALRFSVLAMQAIFLQIIFMVSQAHDDKMPTAMARKENWLIHVLQIPRITFVLFRSSDTGRMTAMIDSRQDTLFYPNFDKMNRSLYLPRTSKTLPCCITTVRRREAPFSTINVS